MRTNLNRAAIAINDIFRRSVSYPTLDWDEPDDSRRQSKHDDTARQHPMLCGYEKQTPEQKLERDAVRELLGQASKALNDT